MASAASFLVLNFQGIFKTIGKNEQKMELCVDGKQRIHTQLDILHKKGRLRPIPLGKCTHNSVFCTKLGVILPSGISNDASSH